MVIRLPLPPPFTGNELFALSRVPTLSRVRLLFLEQQQAEHRPWCWLRKELGLTTFTTAGIWNINDVKL